MSRAAFEDQAGGTGRPNYTLRERLRWWLRRQRFLLVVLLFALAFYFIFFFPYIFHTIESGHAGVLFRRFGGGTETRYVLDEGLQIIAPWNKLVVYDVRVQQIEHAFHVISSNGLFVDVTLSIRYHPRVQLLGVLHKEVGPAYMDKIVVPEVQALAREVFGRYSPEELYTTKRSLIEQTMQGAIRHVAEKYVELDDLLIKSISLPPAIQAAIQAKLVEEQRALEMKFRIARELQEADRKVIEAEGVNQAQTIIRRSLNDQILQYKGIEATLALSASPNAKIVVVGGKDGMPLILNTETLAPNEPPVELSGPPAMLAFTNFPIVFPSLTPLTNLPSLRLPLTNVVGGPGIGP
jgi:regulator of protease activity HflC (stomatin/prohibitin superfamily)